MNCNLCQFFIMAKKLLPGDGGSSSSACGSSKPSVRYKSDRSFFHSPRHNNRDFAVHPDWVSERLGPKTEQPYPLSVHAKFDNALTAPPSRGRSSTRRAQSANGSANRDPITWRTWPSKQRQVLSQPKSSELSKQNHVQFDLAGLNKNTKPKSEYRTDTPCFARSHTSTRPFFTIHPDWASETLFVRGTSIKEPRPVRHVTPEPRRCRSAPPPRSRNPITWENW